MSSDAGPPGDPAILSPALEALDAAVRGIGGTLDLEQVLQLIVDRVRDLVAAQYAALGIVDEADLIADFITSGINIEQRAAIGDLPHGRGLLGLIIRENRSYRIPNIAQHPESYGFPANHPPMHSFLGVPVTVRGEVVGRLYLTNKLRAAEFSADDQVLVEMFALHAGIAIENAHLYERAQRLVVLDERDRISRDLHDGVIQSIYAVTLSLDDIPELVGESSPEAGQRVDDAIDALQTVIRDLRNFIYGLAPLLLDSGGLLDGLQTLAAELRRNTGTEIEVLGEEPDDMSAEVFAELLVIAREALANVARHSIATNASIHVVAPEGRVQLEIADDGRGFKLGADVAHGHHGLANMRARAEALGGSINIQTAPGTGTRIIVAVPRTRSRPGVTNDS